MAPEMGIVPYITRLCERGRCQLLFGTLFFSVCCSPQRDGRTQGRTLPPALLSRKSRTRCSSLGRPQMWLQQQWLGRKQWRQHQHELRSLLWLVLQACWADKYYPGRAPSIWPSLSTLEDHHLGRWGCGIFALLRKKIGIGCNHSNRLSRTVCWSGLQRGDSRGTGPSFP